MNNDLISRSALKKAIWDESHSITTFTECGAEEARIGLTITEIEQIIDNAPTVERPHGEWLDEQFVAFHLTCNKCGCNIRRQKDTVFEGEYNYNFCPNCGADIRGDT